jgi:hypothetical protein
MATTHVTRTADASETRTPLVPLTLTLAQQIFRDALKEASQTQPREKTALLKTFANIHSIEDLETRLREEHRKSKRFQQGSTHRLLQASRAAESIHNARTYIDKFVGASLYFVFV